MSCCRSARIAFLAKVRRDLESLQAFAFLVVQYHARGDLTCAAQITRLWIVTLLQSFSAARVSLAGKYELFKASRSPERVEVLEQLQ